MLVNALSIFCIVYTITPCYSIMPYRRCVWAQSSSPSPCWMSVAAPGMRWRLWCHDSSFFTSRNQRTLCIEKYARHFLNVLTRLASGSIHSISYLLKLSFNTKSCYFVVWLVQVYFWTTKCKNGFPFICSVLLIGTEMGCLSVVLHAVGETLKWLIAALVGDMTNQQRPVSHLCLILNCTVTHSSLINVCLLNKPWDAPSAYFPFLPNYFLTQMFITHLSDFYFYLYLTSKHPWLTCIAVLS